MESKQEIIQKYKEELLENIRREMDETGAISTYIQLIGTKEDVDKPVIIHIDTAFEDEEDKHFFMSEGIPVICKKIKEHNINPICVCFVAEAWMTMFNKEKQKESKEEVIIINMSTQDGDDMIVYNIVRHPYEVDESGDLKSKVELVESDAVKDNDEKSTTAGRFTNLYQKFIDGLIN